MHTPPIAMDADSGDGPDAHLAPPFAVVQAMWMREYDPSTLYRLITPTHTPNATTYKTDEYGRPIHRRFWRK